MKQSIQKFLHLFGYEMKAWKYNQAEIDANNKKAYELALFIHNHKWLQMKGLKTIVDIGANEGQFAERMRILFPEIMIYSFEPIPTVFAKLEDNFKNDLHFKCFNVGLGDKDDRMTFHLNDYTPSSSLLKMNHVHKDNFPQTESESEIPVLIKRLDDVLSYQNLEKPYMVKIDVQGFEDKVINGGLKLLENADLIIIETTFVELYEEQPLFDVIYDKLRNLGFKYVGNEEQLVSPMNGEVLQADSIFVKNKN